MKILCQICFNRLVCFLSFHQTAFSVPMKTARMLGSILHHPNTFILWGFHHTVSPIAGCLRLNENYEESFKRVVLF